MTNNNRQLTKEYGYYSEAYTYAYYYGVYFA